MLIIALIPLVGILIAFGGVAAFFYGFWVHAVGWVVGGIVTAIVGLIIAVWLLDRLSKADLR